MSKTQKQNGFTLIELLIIISIIGLMSSLLLIALSKARSSTRDSTKLQNGKQLATAIALYYDTNGSFPLQNQSSSFYFSDGGTNVYMVSSVNTDIIFGAPTWASFLSSLSAFLKTPASVFRVTNFSYDYFYQLYVDQNNQPLTVYWKYDPVGGVCHRDLAPNGGIAANGIIMSPLEVTAPTNPVALNICIGPSSQITVFKQ